MAKKLKMSKRVVRRVKKSMAKKTKRKAAKNMDTFFLRTKVLGNILPSQGVTVANYVSSFWKLLDPTSAVGITQNSEFGLYSRIYDRVRINRMRIKITPKANTFDASQAQNDGQLTLTGDGKVHTCVVREPDGFSGSIPRLQRQPSYKGYSLLKTFARKYAIKYPTGVWLDCQNIYSDLTLLQRLGAFGGVGIYAENLPEDFGEIFNEPWAALEITYDCVFQGKISSNLSLADGKVTVSVPTPVTLTPSRIVGITGTFADTVVTGTDPVTGEYQEAPRMDDSAP